MSASKKIPVIIDTDPGVDDIIAILLALASPELEILAFVVTFGNTDVESSYRNILKAYQAIARYLELYPSDTDRFPNYSQQVKPILARGCEGPLEGELHSAQYFHGRDGLGDITLRHPELDVDDAALNEHHPNLRFANQPGVEAVLDLLRSRSARSITYIALGPLTTLANLMRRDSPLIERVVGRVVCMGGALDVPGNTSPVAEFNFFADPFAVKELLLSDQAALHQLLNRFVLLPLDITTSHELPFLVYKTVVDTSFDSSKTPSMGAGKSPITHFTSSFLERTREIMIEFGKDAMELHDIVAIWCAIENPPLLDDSNRLNAGWKGSTKLFDIERLGEITRGMLVVDRRDAKESVYSPGVNRAQAQKELDQTHPLHFSETTAAPVQVESRESYLKSSKLGVLCVTHTPGPKVLLQMLLNRVWGVE